MPWTDPPPAVSILTRLDRINPESTHPSVLGGSVTVVFGAIVVFVFARIIIRHVNAPAETKTELLWSSMVDHLPFQLSIVAEEGHTCTVAVRYSDPSRCPGDGYDSACSVLTPSSPALPFCYSGVPTDGVFVSCAGPDGDDDQGGILGATVTSETDDPYMRTGSPLHSGRTQLALVETHDRTRAPDDPARDRREYFPTLLGLAALSPPACVPDARPAQLVLAAALTRRTVTPAGPLSLYSDLGGAFESTCLTATLVASLGAAVKLARKRGRGSGSGGEEEAGRARERSNGSPPSDACT